MKCKMKSNFNNKFASEGDTHDFDTSLTCYPSIHESSEVLLELLPKLPVAVRETVAEGSVHRLWYQARVVLVDTNMH